MNQNWSLYAGQNIPQNRGNLKSQVGHPRILHEREKNQNLHTPKVNLPGGWDKSETSKGHPVIKCLSDINREGTEKFNEIMSLISAYIQIYLNSLVYETLFRRDSRIGSKKE